MDISKVRTTGDRVLIRFIKASYKKGLILDPHAGDRKTPFARVISQGEGVKRDLVDKIVLYDIYEGVRLDEDHMFINEEFLKAIIEDDNNNDNKDGVNG